MEKNKILIRLEKNYQLSLALKTLDNILSVINLLRISKLDYDRIEKINFFKSGRFDIILIIKFC